MERIACLLVLVLGSQYLSGQDPDSASLIGLSEVVVVEKRPLNNHIQHKPLAALDEYLEQAPGISMVRRGSYAWEPMINGMSSERLSVTIDGMHIFGACTDKMDPVTSYVDVSNLSEVAVVPGQQGASFGPTVGGSVNLSRKQHDFCHEGWGLGIDAGLESNGLLQTYGAAAQYLHDRFFVDLDFMYRHATDYMAGEKQEVPYSQYTKYNLSGSAGLRLNDHHKLIASLIFDRAHDVGYPALPMDVSLAQAQIVSLEHNWEKAAGFLRRWSTRAYYNQVKHIMDDTQRPDVVMHMDMPGSSRTGGFVSRLSGIKGRHMLDLNLNGYYSQALADMTMYPDSPEEDPMYMLTWPDVRTQYSGLQLEHRFTWNEKHSLRSALGGGWQRNNVADAVGLASLRIFYPEMPAERNFFLPAASITYAFRTHCIELQAGAGYGERAPSVSEGYGYYLFNSFDRYDHIGNPQLKPERSAELNTMLTWKKEHFSLDATSSFYHIFNYIIGIPDPELLAMTPGAAGVRVYQGLDGANLFAAEVRAEYRPHPSWKLRSAFTYNLGRDEQGQPLPLIRPFTYRFALAYRHRFFDAEFSVEGASRQYGYSTAYGEDETPAYAVLNLAAGYTWLKNDHRVYFRGGIENLANRLYSTFSDWNNIPSKGINAYVSVSYMLDRKRTNPKTNGN